MSDMVSWDIYIAWNFWQIIYSYLHQLSGADKVIGESWQLVTAIHDEDDSLIICDGL